MADIHIRIADIRDADLILGFVKELAAYENASDQVTATNKEIANSLFGDDSTVTALICEIDHQPAGFAVYFYNYSTWLGEKGLYLEDLYVSPQFRGKGAGKALLTFLAKIANENNCQRFEFSVLDWNQPAIEFYKSLGATPLKEWVKYRFSGSALEKLSRES